MDIVEALQPFITKDEVPFALDHNSSSAKMEFKPKFHNEELHIDELPRDETTKLSTKETLLPDEQLVALFTRIYAALDRNDHVECKIAISELQFYKLQTPQVFERPEFSLDPYLKGTSALFQMYILDRLNDPPEPVAVDSTAADGDTRILRERLDTLSAQVSAFTSANGSFAEVSTLGEALSSVDINAIREQMAKIDEKDE